MNNFVKLKKHFSIILMFFLLAFSLTCVVHAQEPISVKTGAVVEVTVLPIKPGTEAQFRKAYTAALPILKRQRGYRSDRWGKRIEGTSPAMVVIVEWDCLASHEQFQRGPEYSNFVGSIRDFLASDPQIFHFEEASTPLTRFNS